MKKTIIKLSGAFLSAIFVSGQAGAYTIDTGNDDLTAVWVSNITGGIGIRTKQPSCALTGNPNLYGCGSAANVAQWGNGANGDLNYRKNQAYAGYLSVTSEVLMTMPSQGLKFLVRGTALKDFLATRTDQTPLAPDAKSQTTNDAQLLDLWVQKDFQIGDQRAHVRFGNQVINWGESYFAAGGINASNALDIQKLLVPGTQLKQALLPAPMLSFASSLPGGFSTESYLQFQWNGNRYPAVGTFWSASNVFGRGTIPLISDPNNFNIAGVPGGFATNYGTINGSNRPQFGARLNYKPAGADINFSAYYENYTDKAPVLTYLASGSDARWSYAENRQLFGLSTNFSVGDWAIGSELSYRPKDAVAMSGCYLAGGPADANTNLLAGADCKAYQDMHKYQFDINAQLNMTTSTQPALAWIGADMAVLTAELTWIRYPGVDPNKQYTSTVNGQQVYQLMDAGYATWLNYAANSSGYSPIAAGQGTANAGGLTLDFNWTYDGTVIPGWQVTPGVTFYDAIKGYTPTFSANYESGAKSANFYLLFNQNPQVWQAGLNYTVFYGGSPVTQPYGDRNFIGAFVTRNF